MTLFVYIAGVDRTSAIRLEDGVQQITVAADGDKATSGIKIDDPTGSLTILQWSTVRIIETDCDPSHCFSGYVYQVAISRGPYLTGPGRIWVLEVIDLNALLHLRVLHGAEAKRPQETGSARLAWLMTTTGMAGIVHDNGFIMANAWLYDEADYRGEYADDVLSSIVAAASAGRWTYYVYWDHASVGEEVCLVYGESVATFLTSSLAISNVLSDVDQTTTFFAYQQPELVGTGDEIYDGVYIDYTGHGALYRQLASTYTTFGIHRDLVFESTRNNNLASASLHADYMLAASANQIETITCTVRLPSNKVNLIEAGMRLAVRFEHLPGYTTTTYVRVTRRTFLFTPGTNEFYDVQFELSNKGIIAVGGGGTGVFPPPASAASVVQTGCGFGLGGSVFLVFPNPITAGDMLVAWLVSRGDNTIAAPDGSWTTVQQVSLGVPGINYNPAAMYYKIADSTEAGQTFLTFLSAAGTSRPKILGWEIAGVSAPTAHVAVDQGAALGGPTRTFNLPSLTLGAGIAIIGVGIGSDTVAGSTVTPRDHLYLEGGDGFFQTAFGADQVVTSGSQVYTAFFGVAGGDDRHDAVAAFFPGSAAAGAPGPGGPVPYEIVVMSGVNGTTAHPFATGSLRVFVDNVDQTAAIVSTDPSCGTFSLAFAPRPSEVVTVTYQGI